jgi:hypothetical protein
MNQSKCVFMSFYLLYTNHMLFWILQSMFLSIIFILVIHHLIHFFKTTLTIPKMKDLVNSPIQKYDNMYNIIGNSQSTSLSSLPSLPSFPSPSSTGDSSSFLPSLASPSSTGDSSSFLPSLASSSSTVDSSSFLMKNELKHFLKTQLKR